MELKETEDIKEGNVLGSLKEDDVMSRCVYPFTEYSEPHVFVVACTADFHKKLKLEIQQKYFDRNLEWKKFNI